MRKLSIGRALNPFRFYFARSKDGSLRCSALIVAGAVACFVMCSSARAQDLFDLFMSPSDEARIGKEEHPKILEQFGGNYADPKILSYVNSIGKFLVQTSETPNARFTFTVLNTPLVNAFALPGGYVYITRGILALASNEAELAGVIAHEIGHVAARHSADRVGNSVLANLGLVVLGAVTGSSVLHKVGEVGAFAALQAYSRDDEFEADQLGVRYLARAGFLPRAVSTFLRKLEAHSRLEAKIREVAPEQGFDFFATHPRTEKRVTRAVELAQDHRVTDPIVASKLYLNKIDGLLFGDDPKQGFVRGSRFIHPVLRFEFVAPDGFTILNGQKSVVAKGNDGEALQFDFDNRGGQSVANYLRNDWAQGQALSRLETLNINGFPAATAVIHPRGGSGNIVLRLVAIGFDSRLIYRFLFATPSNFSKERRRKVEHTALSFRRLSRAEALTVKPLRIALHRVTDGETQEKLAQRMAVSSFKLERFRVLNAIDSNVRLEVGRIVKLVLE